MKKVVLTGDVCKFLDGEVQKSFRANLTFDTKTNTTTGDLAYPDRTDLLCLLNSALAEAPKTKLTTAEAAEIRAAVKALKKITRVK